MKITNNLIKYIVLVLIAVTPYSSFAQKKVETSIHTADIDRYWLAYDLAKKTSDTSSQVRIFQEVYLDQASPGLQGFIVSRKLTARRYVRNMNRYPAFWSSIRSKTVEVASSKSQIEHYLKRLKFLYNNFHQPEVFFTIGCLGSAGTTNNEKILIGTEMAAADSSVDAHELNPWLRNMFKNNQDVVYVVTHEAVHTQQNGQSLDETTINLLGACLREGACEFVAEVVLQKHLVSPYMTFGKSNEKILWEKFKNEIHGHNFKDWLFNGDAAPGGQPDLGYFMGYAICKYYYDHQSDKKAALKNIIEIDYQSPAQIDKFFDLSNYAHKWN